MAGLVDANELHALVDMGSNGIRFSITNLSPRKARIMPTVFQDRASISLYDAQYSKGTKQPIPEETISQVVNEFVRFKTTCEEFQVPPENIRVLATEATREAVNSVELRDEISSRTGWQVEMLSKSEEGKIGAYGVASSLPEVDGLIMDLGGGSTQLTWIQVVKGKITLGEGGSISMPFGAAALLRRIEETKQQGESAQAALREEIENSIRQSYSQLGIPESLADDDAGVNLYLSGGGFRGWGNVLIDKHHISPYPIPIINGFRASADDFTDTAAISSHVSAKEHNVFRVSERRASQLPAVVLLVSALAAAVPRIRTVRFCQGGVREGALFSKLSPRVRAERPLSVATRGYAPPSTQRLKDLTESAIPGLWHPPPWRCPEIVATLLQPLMDLIHTHASFPQEARAPAALRCTTTGFLTSVHGLTHEERAGLGLVLCERWGGEIPPTDQSFYGAMQELAGREVAWWCKFVGRVVALVGQVYPAGVLNEEEAEKVSFKAQDEADGVGLIIKFGVKNGAETYAKAVKEIEKVGKKKHWIGGKEGWGLKVHVDARNSKT